MTNETLELGIEDISGDYFAGLFENRVTKLAAVTFSGIASLILLPLVYVIIWFEKFGSDNKRTLLNKLVSSVCWTCFEWFLLVQTIDMIRYLVGPLPSHLCLFQLHLRNAIFSQQMIILDAIVVGRYVFVFCLKNPAAFNDDFWSKFINIWIVGFSVAQQIVAAQMPGKSSVYFYICTGKNPQLDRDVPLKNHTYIMVQFIATALLHTFGSIRLYLYNRKSSLKSSGPIVGLRRSRRETLSDLSVNAGLVFVYLVTLVVIDRLNGIDTGDLNRYPNYLYEYYIRMVSPHLFSFTVVSLHYYRHPKLRAALNMICADLKRSLTS